MLVDFFRDFNGNRGLDNEADKITECEKNANTIHVETYFRTHHPQAEGSDGIWGGSIV